MADNFHFDLTGVSLDKCLDIAFGQYRKAVGWAVIDGGDNRSVGGIWGSNRADQRLVLFWVEHPDMTPLPAPMGLEEAVPFVKSWLVAADYGDEPDQDGDNGKGWRVYNEAWGHVGHMYQAFVAIEPVWLMYGK